MITSTFTVALRYRMQFLHLEKILPSFHFVSFSEWREGDNIEVHNIEVHMEWLCVKRRALSTRYRALLAVQNVRLF